MTRSSIHHFVKAADISGSSAPGTISLNPDPLNSTTFINPQRIADETGAWQIELNQDPGVGATGLIVIQGRLSPDTLFVIISSIDISTFIGSSDLSALVSGIPILPHMQVRAINDGTWLAAAGTVLNVWVQE